MREVEHLASASIPAVIDQLRRPGRPGPVLADDRLLSDPVGAACDRALRVLADAVMDDRVRTDQTAQEVVRSTMGAARALAAQAERLLERIQQQISDPELLQDVFDLDLTQVLLRREAQRTAVVCGDMPGTAREDTVLEAAVMAARSRVRHHQRVSVVDHVPREADGRFLGVQAPAAEPVIMVLSELLDNAVYCSVGSGPVRAEIHRTATGVVVEVSDSGAGLDTVEKQAFVRMALEPERRLLLRDLGSPPRFGMAAVGRLVGRFDGLILALGPSPARGLRVDLHIHSSLLVPVAERARPAGSGALLQPIPQPPQTDTTFPPSAGAAEEQPGQDRAALPSRAAPGAFPRRQRKSPDSENPAPNRREPLPDRDAGAVRSAYASMQSGTRLAREQQADQVNGPVHTTFWESR